MDTSTILSLVLGAALAGFVQGLSGFAFSLVSLSVWAWTLDPKLAAVMAVFGGLTGQTIAAVTVRRGFDVARLWPFLLGGLAGIPVGVLLLPLVEPNLFKAGLGILLAVWCPIMLFAPHLPPVRFGGRLADGAIGLGGGIMGGFGGFSGVLPTLWCSLRRMDKDVQRSIVQNFNLTMLAATMLGYVLAGNVTREMWPAFAIVAPAMLIPSLLGGKLYIGISDQAFRRIVLSLLTLSGIALLASSLPRLLSG
ncbi:MAG: sulfite exporter TauE/SafE family protein [Bosea sp.]|uniref:sulfite exporter TauE/SafE family protein n=1 Tax=Bosea sp. (in: a-proteobacteria) TaxID=1871050 RepID=UPI0023869477|nr:sulfite exporter TauE/SafE family protein [Bosea sp. (in: a-proteobacteria)]MCP4736212.1 sulfite exporter TauE/SafE family protein [Bosea sp. (in: a-proteobacteria)]